MKKLSILLVLMTLISCSKDELNKGKVDYFLNGITNQNSTLTGVKYIKSTEYIQYHVKVNDTVSAGFILSTESNKQYCFSFIETRKSNGTTIADIIDNKMSGSYKVVNGIVNGKFTGSSVNYIHFENYQL